MVVRYEQRANLNRERERKRTDMEICFDGRSVANDYTVPNTLNLKHRSPGVKYEPYEVRNAARTEPQEQQVRGPREEQKS